jgi:predicted permease
MAIPIFLSLLIKTIPLYLNIGLGYIAGKVLNACRDTIARVMFYLINPIIIFNGILNIQLDASILSLPLITFGISTLLCLIYYGFSRNMWEDTSKNLLAYSAGTGNMGYFGLPVALMLFDNEGEGIYILLILGVTLYENSIGYYMLAKGTHTAKECFAKITRIPALYTCFAALTLNYLHAPIPEVFQDFMTHIKGTYTVLGMMMIGIGFAALPHFKMDGKYLGMIFTAKFLAWPALVMAFNTLDTLVFGFYPPIVHQALVLASIVPVAVNTVIVASLLNTKP